jgi:hypothetical protein
MSVFSAAAIRASAAIDRAMATRLRVVPQLVTPYTVGNDPDRLAFEITGVLLFGGAARQSGFGDHRSSDVHGRVAVGDGSISIDSGVLGAREIRKGDLVVELDDAGQELQEFEVVEAVQPASGRCVWRMVRR